MVALAVVGVSSNAPNYWSESGTVAQNLISGWGYTFNFYGLREAQPLRSFMPPLFIWLLYACLHFSTQPALALAAVHAVLSSLTAVAIFLLAAQLSGRKSVALLSGLAAAGYPVMVLMITIPISLTLHLAVLAWALVFTALLAPRPNWLLALVTGATWGVLALGRPAIVAFLPLVLLWLWWNHRTRQDWLKSCGLLLLATILVLLPWTVRNFLIQGRLVLVSTNSGYTFWNGNNPFSTGTANSVYTEKLDEYLGRPHDPAQPSVVQNLHPYPVPLELQAEVATISEVDLDRRQFQAGLAFIRQQPKEWLALMGQKAVGFLWFRRGIGALYDATWTAYYRPLYVILLILTIAGLAISTRRWRQYSLLYLLFVFYTAIHVFYNVQTRFRWEIEPFFLIFAALCLVEVYDRVSSAVLADADRLDPHAPDRV
jgi:4-amino-4-deoxy-L-arabinose transferase-like glycosyltransferase